jgi:hypothetical protein
MMEEDELAPRSPAGTRSAWSPGGMDEPADFRPTGVVGLRLALREVPDE